MSTAVSKTGRKLYPSAFILYLNYFIHGIGCSILGQQVMKEALAAQWGTADDAVTLVAAALGLGRLITLPFSGPISDKMGRRVSSLIGIFSYAVFFFGVAYSPNMQVAYAAAILGGAANSFLDTGVIPACVEILEPRSGLATMLTKFFISISQLLLPFMLGFVAAANMSYNTILIAAAVVILVIGVLTFKIPMPAQEKAADGKSESFIQNLKHAKFTLESVALIAIGFTCTATFQLWLNCAQKFGTEIAGMKDASIMQTWYSAGTIATMMLIIVYIVRTPMICQIGSFVIGYSAAGGVLQLATATVNDLFPKIKGTITSIIMIASSLSNYTILSAAGKVSASSGPQAVITMNIIITVIGVILALFVNMRYGKLVDKVEN